MLTLFNSLTKTKEQFKPIRDSVGIYTCGPTVYNFPHIGNYRAYLVADILKRYLLFSGYQVKHIINITDVDDKIIKKVSERHILLQELTQQYEQAFMEDLTALHILPADVFPRATEHIDAMIALIQKLLEKNLAYKGEDGSVYYRVAACPNYGVLAHLDKAQLKAGASGRVDADEYEKDAPADFALWKAYTAEDGDIFWDTSLGKGRPGWHIECSAMSTQHLGEQFDIHTGGIDLLFPHHENEIAQNYGFSVEQSVKTWLHNEWLLVEGKKMSKSLDNFYTLKDILRKNYTPEAIRYLLFSTHYRQQLNFTFDALESAQQAVNRLQDFISNLQTYATDSSAENNPQVTLALRKLEEQFIVALDDDLNVNQALAALFDFVKEINTTQISSEHAQEILVFLSRINEVLAVFSFETLEIPDEVSWLVMQREQARKEKDFSKADELRQQLADLGYVVEDTSEGAHIKKLK